MQSELSRQGSQVTLSSARQISPRRWRVASRGWFRAYHVPVSGKIVESQKLMRNREEYKIIRTVTVNTGSIKE